MEIAIVIVIVLVILLLYYFRPVQNFTPCLEEEELQAPYLQFNSMAVPESNINDGLTRSTGYTPNSYPEKFKNAPRGLYNPLRS